MGILLCVYFSATDDADDADFIFFSAYDWNLGEASLKIRVVCVICG